MNLRWPTLCAAALALAACLSQSQEGPAEIKWDRDTCQGCGMVISDQRFAAEIRGGPRNAWVKFDDLGCAVSWLDRQPWAKDASTQIWVKRLSDGAWVDARAAHYVTGKTSPMGYGFGALGPAEPGLTFEALQDQVRAKGQHPH